MEMVKFGAVEVDINLEVSLCKIGLSLSIKCNSKLWFTKHKSFKYHNT